MALTRQAGRPSASERNDTLSHQLHIISRTLALKGHAAEGNELTYERLNLGDSVAEECYLWHPEVTKTLPLLQPSRLAFNKLLPISTHSDRDCATSVRSIEPLRLQYMSFPVAPGLRKNGIDSFAE